MLKAVERARAIGADALQIFADNPTSWRRRAAPPTELPDFRARLVEVGIGPLAIHASYLVNLAGPDEDLFEKSVARLAHELEVAPSYGASFVNVHVGSHRGTGVDAGIARVAEGVTRALDIAGLGTAVDPGAAGGEPGVGPGCPSDDGDTRRDCAPLLVLENPAGGGDGLGATLDELEGIFEAVASRGVPARRVGLCLDTAHLWGAGYDIASPDVVDALLEEVDRRFGIERLVMVHLNDSKAPRGSRLDRHQHIGAGGIGPAGLARILVHPALAHVAYYLETPGMDEGYDAVNLERARRLAAGLPLAPLPPGADEVRGSRARTPAPA